MNRIINAKEVERIERVLAADDMRGRRIFSSEIDKAADFIAAEFKAAGLQTWGNSNSNSFRQEFSVVSAKLINTSCKIDGQEIDAKNVVVITTQPEVSVNEKSGFEKVTIAAGKNIFSEAQKFVRSGKNYFVLVDTSFSKNFSRLASFKRGMFKSENSVVFVLTAANPSVFTVEAKHEITEQKLANVVGILPGKSKKNEYVIFSGHYDHLGTGKPINGDSIYNGANDDAAGTTAVIMLAKYFAKIKNNERTIVLLHLQQKNRVAMVHNTFPVSLIRRMLQRCLILK